MEKERLMNEIAGHIGVERAIGMGELFTVVYGEGYLNRINDTRKLRKLITELKREGTPICSCKDGYYIPVEGKELEEYCSWLQSQGLRKLAMAARLRKMTLPSLLGQLSTGLTLEESHETE